MEKESNDQSEFSHESEGMTSSSKSKNDNAYQLLHFTNQFGDDEGFQNDLSSNFEDKEMVDQFDADNKFEHEFLSERLSKGFILDNEVAAYGNGFSDVSCFARSGHPKHGNENDVDIDATCVIDEEEIRSSCNSDFTSYAASFYDNELGSGFKVYDNLLYDDNVDDSQPIFCHNVQRGPLHGVINLLF